MADQDSVPIETLAKRIHVVRGHKVMMDSDLAALYGVPTKRLNEQVRRNRQRFPTDFAFKLTVAEDVNLRSQFATSSSGYGGRRHKPFAFTEHGAIMAAAVLNSPRAVQMSVFVVRAFVQLRESISAYKVIALKLTELERKVSTHSVNIAEIFVVLRKLMIQPERKRRGIGFTADVEAGQKPTLKDILDAAPADARKQRAPGWDEMPPVGRER